MKVGDLVKTYGPNGIIGIVLQIDGNQIECLWTDGDQSWCGTWLVSRVEVINESR